MRQISFFAISGFICFSAAAQTGDTVKPRVLDSVLVRAKLQPSLPEVQGVYIFSGKKTNDIIPDASGANLAGNNARMVFARVPGINVWEMDGAGTVGKVGVFDALSCFRRDQQPGGRQIFYQEDQYVPGSGYPARGWSYLLCFAGAEVVAGSAGNLLHLRNINRGL